jgi:hypothetical protein
MGWGTVGSVANQTRIETPLEWLANSRQLKSTRAPNIDAATFHSKHTGIANGQRNINKFLAAITAGWSANIEMNGEPLKYNHENAVKLYLEQDWIGKQVLDFAQDMANYDPKLKKA